MFSLEPITTKLIIHSSFTVHFWKAESFLNRKQFPKFSLCKIRYASGGAIYKSLSRLFKNAKKAFNMLYGVKLNSNQQNNHINVFSDPKYIRKI